jgi:hypothetical protein
MLKVAFGEETGGKTQVFECFSKFRSSVTVVEDVECLGCPLTSKTDERVDPVKELVL